MIARAASAGDDRLPASADLAGAVRRLLGAACRLAPSLSPEITSLVKEAVAMVAPGPARSLMAASGKVTVSSQCSSSESQLEQRLLEQVRIQHQRQLTRLRDERCACGRVEIRSQERARDPVVPRVGPRSRPLAIFRPNHRTLELRAVRRIVEGAIIDATSRRAECLRRRSVSISDEPPSKSMMTKSFPV